jgi:hypothetical protein
MQKEQLLAELNTSLQEELAKYEQNNPKLFILKL